MENMLIINNNDLRDSDKLEIKVAGKGNLINISEFQNDNNDVLNNFPKSVNGGKLSIGISGNNNSVIIGSISIEEEGCLKIVIRGNNNKIFISSKVFIKRKLNIAMRPAGPNVSLNKCTLQIGAENWFNGNVDLDVGESNTKISIGAYCLFANNISMSTSDNHSIFDVNTGRILNIAGDIEISNHVWICRDVLILNNSFIPKNSVIGAKSLVNKRMYEENVLIAGVPAKIIKRGINWSQNLYTGQGFIDINDLNKINTFIL